MLRHPRDRRGVAADRARVARGLRPHGGAASPSPRAPATRPRAGSASASTGPGPLSVAMGTSGVVFAALPEYRADPQARVHAFCHAVPGAWHQMGVMLSAAGSLAWLRNVVGGDVSRADRRGRAVGPGSGGADVPAVPDRRAHAARRPERARRVHRPGDPARPRRADARRAGGRGLRAARLVRPGGRGRARPRVRRRRALGAVAEDRRVGARDPARAAGRRRGRGLRRGAARRRRRRALGRRPRGRRGVRAHPFARSQPVAEWIDPYRELRERYRALYPALQATTEETPR